VTLIIPLLTTVPVAKNTTTPPVEPLQDGALSVTPALIVRFAYSGTRITCVTLIAKLLTSARERFSVPLTTPVTLATRANSKVPTGLAVISTAPPVPSPDGGEGTKPVVWATITRSPAT
jgi:hypothetical protein